MLTVAQSIPDEPAQVEFIAKDTSSAKRVSADSCVAPWTAARTPNAFSVEFGSNRTRTFSRGETFKDAPNHRRLHLFDLTATALSVRRPGKSITVTEPATRSPLLDAAAKAATRLVSEVFKKERVHRAFEANVKFADLALGQGDDTNACEAHLLKEGGDVFLIAADAIERFGEHNVELAISRPGEQLLIAGA